MSKDASSKADPPSGDTPKSNPMADLIAQMQGMASGLMNATVANAINPLAGLSGGSGSASPPSVKLPPAPGALFAAQLEAITKGISAQRQQIEALQSQLAAFDQQLSVLEQMLTPLAEWTATWAGLERTMTGRPPK
jgi:hypothetical protein